MGGHGGGCAKDGSTINGANTPARGEDIREGICGVWWRLVGVMVGGGRHGCFVEVAVGRVGEFER